MKEFEFFEPKTVQEACALLGKFKGRARPLAGGTDLLVQLKAGWLQLTAVVNLKRIKGLSKITFTRKEGLRVGALVTWTQLLESAPVGTHYPLLRKAAETLGSYQVRNVGTLAGNICHASPAANGALALLAYEAQCVAHGPRGERIVPAEKMFVGVQKNALRSGELLTEIRFPPPPPGVRGSYYKFSLRKAMDLATVGVGTLVSTRNGTFDLVRIALAAVGPTPFRARRAERTLMGRATDDSLIRKAAAIAASECSPITDVRGSGEYRLELVKELTYRAIQENIH
jgi:carbon-monoxide dehydrogenase medium subunit